MDRSLNRTLTSPRLPRRVRVGAPNFLSRMLEVWQQRQALARLDAHARRDLGLSDAEIDIETARPIWDVPNHWRL